MSKKLSTMGYRDDSPYRNRKSITIDTPEGLIDMSQTGIPLMAEDETGYQVMLNPYSGMHKFPGKRVTERRFQQGGDYEFLFGDDDESDYETSEDEDLPATAPSANPRQQDAGYQSLLDMAMSINVEDYGDPYLDKRAYKSQPHGASYAVPTSTGSVTPPPATSTPAGDRSVYAYNYLKNKGVPDHVAAGMVGNFIQESGNFREDVIQGTRSGDNGTSFGIAQWHIGKGTDRWNPLIQYAKKTGRDHRTLEFQLDYALMEAKERGDYDKVLKARNSEEAANLFAKYYERPAIIDKNRAKYARQLNPYQMGGTYTEIFK